MKVQEGLRGVIRLPSGTAHSLDSADFGIPVMGKTGTTSNFRDALFVGSTYGLTGVTIAVRVGFDDNRTLGDKETGGRAALPIFREIMQNLYQKKLVGPVPSFPRSIEDGIDNYLAAPTGPLLAEEALPAGRDRLKRSRPLSPYCPLYGIASIFEVCRCGSARTEQPPRDCVRTILAVHTTMDKFALLNRRVADPSLSSPQEGERTAATRRGHLSKTLERRTCWECHRGRFQHRGNRPDALSRGGGRPTRPDPVARRSEPGPRSAVSRGCRAFRDHYRVRPRRDGGPPRFGPCHPGADHDVDRRRSCDADRGRKPRARFRDRQAPRGSSGIARRSTIPKTRASCSRASPWALPAVSA